MGNRTPRPINEVYLDAVYLSGLIEAVDLMDDQEPFFNAKPACIAIAAQRMRQLEDDLSTLSDAIGSNTGGLHQ